jgi:hypothetical protein
MEEEEEEEEGRLLIHIHKELLCTTHILNLAMANNNKLIIILNKYRLMRILSTDRNTQGRNKVVKG